MWADEGYLVLKYLDESGFCLWSAPNYSYSRVGEQKRQEQTQKRYGNRISILGLWEPDQAFDYGLVQSGFKSESYIAVMNWQAEKAAQRLKQTAIRRQSH